MNQDFVSLSKFLSLVLRHAPERIGLKLDAQGWADVDELLQASAKAGQRLTRETLEEIVAQNEKQRFALSDDGRRIRARQGHSIQVDLGLVPQEPPEHLYHGTATRFLDGILATGLEPRSRQHVHLSLHYATAVEVGRRHGKPIVLLVQASAMRHAGHLFYLSENGVWLTDRVPAVYLEVCAER